MHRKQTGGVVLWATMMFVLGSYAWAAPKFKVLHAFGNPPDGAGTWGSLILDGRGNVYGATSGGGLYAYGTVFELTPRSHGRWSEAILHSFDRNGQDGYTSTAGLIFDRAGNLYGTTQGGGTYEAGTVFELVRGTGGWTETVLYSFGSRSNDAYEPYAGVSIDHAGNLYGTGHSVFEVEKHKGGWTETVIHDFARRKGDGGDPYAGVILDPAGNLYGTTEGGGAYGAGTV